MLGLPATTIKSPFWTPWSLVSRSLNPVDEPISPPDLLDSSCNLSIVDGISSFIDWRLESFLLVSSFRANIMLSALSRSETPSWPWGFDINSEISELAFINFLVIDLCLIISAYASRLAAEGVEVANSIKYSFPPTLFREFLLSNFSETVNGSRGLFSSISSDIDWKIIWWSLPSKSFSLITCITVSNLCVSSIKPPKTALSASLACSFWLILISDMGIWFLHHIPKYTTTQVILLQELQR